MQITSAVSRFSGIVTYDDGTTGVFHTQADGGQFWSISRSESQENMRRLSKYGDNRPYYNYISTSLDNFLVDTMFSQFYWETDQPSTSKNVTDMSARLDITFTLSNGETKSIALVMGNLSDEVIVEASGYEQSDLENLALYQNAGQALFRQIMDTVIVG